MKNIVLVEDNRIMQEHFTRMFRDGGPYALVRVFADAFEAEAFCAAGGADLVLMDVQTLHNHSGLAAGRRIKEAAPHVKVVILTSLVDPEILAKARAGCADSLWYKDYGDGDILDVMERTLAGERVFPDAPPNVELKRTFSAEITPRQMEVLRRFVRGMTYDEIAAELKMTERGVRYNINTIVEKGGFINRHELLTAVLDKRLIVTVLRDSPEEADI